MIVGILGGGQLGKMLAMAGIPIGFSFVVLDPSEHPCASRVAEHIRADYDDPHALAELAQRVDLITFEFENVPASSIAWLQERLPTFPEASALGVFQDRLTEKDMFVAQGIPVPRYERVDALAELKSAVERVGLPAVLKTRHSGYDGKGQYVLRTPGDVPEAWRALGQSPLLLESFVPFDREVALIAVRDRSGAHAFYPLTQTHARDGILRWAATLRDAELQALAEGHATRLMSAVDYVGALGFEFFEIGGALLANEVAPRVHNSGHWSIEAAPASQFENHLRAVAGLPLGSTEPAGVYAMVNYIGQAPALADVLRLPGVHHHEYGKEPRPGRKVGHATATGPRSDTVLSSLETLLRLVGEGIPPRDSTASPLRSA